MTASPSATRAIRGAVVITVAIAVGVAVTIGAALVGHEVLVLRVGDDGIAAIDDTPLMFVAVAGAYLAGGIAGIATLLSGWWRVLRRRT